MSLYSLDSFSLLFLFSFLSSYILYLLFPFWMRPRFFFCPSVGNSFFLNSENKELSFKNVERTHLLVDQTCYLPCHYRLFLLHLLSLHLLLLFLFIFFSGSSSFHVFSSFRFFSIFLFSISFLFLFSPFFRGKKMEEIFFFCRKEKMSTGLIFKGSNRTGGTS